MNVNLFTPKNPEKLDIFQRIGKMYQEKIWFGLDCLEVNRTFKWVDDGTVLSSSWQASMFAPGSVQLDLCYICKYA